MLEDINSVLRADWILSRLMHRRAKEIRCANERFLLKKDTIEKEELSLEDELCSVGAPPPFLTSRWSGSGPRPCVVDLTVHSLFRMHATVSK